MAEDTTKTPTADDIVEDLAEEMGVDEEQEQEEEQVSDAGLSEDSDVAAEDSEDEAEADEAEADEAEADEEEAPAKNKMAALDGVFAVQQGTKKKKKKKKEQPKKKEKKEKKALSEEVDGLFNPDQDKLELEDIVLDDDEFAPKNPVNKLLIAIILALVVGIGGVLYVTTDVFDDLVLLLQGNYQEEMQRRVDQQEREHLEAQMAGMPRFGTLDITGRPHHARIWLNGQIQYGQTSDGQWRELAVTPTTRIQDISIDTLHEIEIEAPGHERRSFTVTQEMWQFRPPSDYFHAITATLTPATPEDFNEFSQRMEGDSGNVYLGTVDFKTVPEGAQIRVNSRVALDENGEELRTPIRTDKYFTLDEEEDKLVERDFRVDMPPNRGNRIELLFPDDEDMPEYVMALNRSMWTCEWKDEAERRRIPERASIMQHCNYTFDMHLDFTALKAYIEEREAERERIEAQRREAMGGSAPSAQAEDSE